MGLYLLDYGAGNVQSLANTLAKLGHTFTWISSPDDFDKATSLIFPGVGAFQTAIDHLNARGLLEPLRAYIASGRPYFGICIGMQVLFQSSLEAGASVKGLGVVPQAIGRFDNADKAVPHMGWNALNLLDEHQPAEGITPGSHFYFVHSFRAAYEPEANPEAACFTHSVTQYGQEVFVASVRKGNVFGCQFHPEKSGAAGLRMLAAWLAEPEFARANALPNVRGSYTPRATHGFTRRIVACMDVRANDQGDLVVTKGDQYDVREKAPTSSLQTNAAGAVRNLGKPVALAARYYAAGADELALLNITSFRHSPLRDQPMLSVVRAAAETVYVPLTIGGGIKDTVDPDGTPQPALEVAGAYFRAGADKVSIGSEAVYAVERLRGKGMGDGTSAIEQIARVYGRQAVVVSVDPKRVYVGLDYDGPRMEEIVRGEGADDGKAWWYQCTVAGGREARDVSVLELARGIEVLGAGEILLNSIDRDGTGAGFDLALVKLVKNAVRIPVVASSGAGKPQHFVDVFQKTGVEAALAAGIFHREEVKIEDVKRAMVDAGLNTRVDIG